MDTETIAEIALATVGVTEVIKNFIQKGGKRIWTFITLIIGAGITCVAIFLPAGVLHGIVAVSGATIFYDTLYKTFQKMVTKLGKGDAE